jgi:ornithine lipid ester-linked acyl 2-hydroxylase
MFIKVLRAFGKDVPSNMQLFPVTSSIIQKSSKTVTCFFSIVQPRKRILPHTGYYGGVLRYHLGVIVPKDRKNCWIRVDDLVKIIVGLFKTFIQVYSWAEGRSVMFDDLYNHEV